LFEWGEQFLPHTVDVPVDDHQVWGEGKQCGFKQFRTQPNEVVGWFAKAAWLVAVFSFGYPRDGEPVESLWQWEHAGGGES
jgi:hypothetical protein